MQLGIIRRRKYARSGGQPHRFLEGHQVGDVAVEAHHLRFEHAAVALFDETALAGHALAAEAFQEHAGDAHQPAADLRQLHRVQRAQRLVEPEALAQGHLRLPP